ncbi:hypothetical protein D9M70_566760 [compost metagenome]
MRQRDVAEDGGQLAARLPFFAEHAERASLRLPREAGRHRSGFLVVDDMPIRHLLESRGLAIEGRRQRMQQRRLTSFAIIVITLFA